MPIETNLNVSPYYDDFDEAKNYYKVVFRPGVSLQARELTQLQSITQDQIEKFGNHVFKSGTIVSGVNFTFNNKYDYAKILDLEVSGQPVAVSTYKDLQVKNSSNLIARIVNTKDGYESQDPQTNYIFLKYLNSGTDGNVGAFAADDTLTVYDPTYPIYNVTINNGSTGISNSDSVYFTSAIVVSSSNVAVGSEITQTVGSNTANVYVMESNTTFGSVTVNNITYSNTAGYTVLKIRPLFADLASSSTTSAKWNIQAGYNVVQGSNTAAVTAIIGTSATATLTTDGSGIVSDISMTSPGIGYEIPPYVSIKSTTGTVSVLDLTAQNFKTQIKVAPSTFNADGSSPVGNGYAFAVTEGVIYQKGYFLRVDPQVVVVNSYSANVNDVTVGLVSSELIVNSYSDQDLLDLSLGTPNFAAPGANRLKITPTLEVVNTTDLVANNTFSPLVEFRDGIPHKQNFATQYGTISKEFEQRTYESSGSFVVDEFLASTKEQPTWSNTAVDLALDPGLAYIEGRRVQTLTNSFVQLDRADTTDTTQNQNLSVNYGSYVFVKELAGYFDTKAGGSVDLYDTAAAQITNKNATITTAGNKIGEARVRFIALDSGVAGTATASYRMYLFDIRMNSGKTFRDVRSIYNSTTVDGICDIVLSTDRITGLPTSNLIDSNRGTLVIPTGAFAVSDIADTSYFFGSANTSANIGITGILTLTSADEFYFGSSVTLTANQRRDIIVVPLSNTQSTNTVSSVNLTSSNSVISATGLSQSFLAGDSIKVYNAANTSQTMYSTVSSVTNATHMTLGSNWTYGTISGGEVARHFPAYVPIPLDDSRVAANTDATGKTLTINISNTVGDVAFSSQVTALAYYNSTKSSTSQISKQVARGLLVKIDLSTNPASNYGPWCLGIPDGFRLNKVYTYNDSSVNTNSTDITKYFYLDNGQLDDYYGHSHLSLINNTGYSLTTSDWLLVELDAFKLSSPTDAGYFTVQSYPLAQNNASRSALGNSAVNIVEIPEFRNKAGVVVDLRDAIDFRPRVTATANLTSVVADITVNPANTVAFGTHDKLFPVPDSIFTADVSFYLPRMDNVIIDVNNIIRVLKGIPSTRPVIPETPPHAMSLARVIIPPYPSLPRLPHPDVADLIIKKSGKGSPIYYKATNYVITQNTSPTNSAAQNMRYTMGDIAKLDRRIENLEYYVSLNQLEKKTKDLNIASEVDPARDVFKNGFFVDPFNDYYLADTANPEFNASISQIDGTLTPVESSVNYQCRFDYLDGTTRNNLHYGDGSNKEPGLIDKRESILTLPVSSISTLVNQTSFTSPVYADGTNVKFMGDAVMEPSTFKTTLQVEVRLTGSDAGPAPSPPSGGGGGSIICQKLADLGFFSPEVNEADQLFGDMLKSEDPAAYFGYLRWARPVVELMEGGGSVSFRKKVLFWIKDEKERQEVQKNIVVFYMNHLARPWSEEMAYRMGAANVESNLAGSMLMTVGLPLCRIINKSDKSNSLPMFAKTLLIWGSVSIILAAAAPLSLLDKAYKKVSGVISKTKYRLLGS